VNNAFIHSEKFEGFAMLRTSSGALDADSIAEFLRCLEELAKKGETLVFVDFGSAQGINPRDAETLVLGISKLNISHGLESVIVGEPSLCAKLNESPLAGKMRLYEKKDNKAYRTQTAKVLRDNSTAVFERLHASAQNAVEAAVRRWTGQPPISIATVTAVVNPAEDVVSCVEMTIDGCAFRVLLSSSQSTLQKMASQILKEEVSITDPAIFDGACELLNYLTGYFRQQLVGDDNVKMTAPQLLQPEEMMAILNQNLDAHRVETQYGQFDFWIEAC